MDGSARRRIPNQGLFDGRVEKRLATSIPVYLASLADPRARERTVTENISLHGARVIRKRSWRSGEEVLISPLTGEFPQVGHYNNTPRVAVRVVPLYEAEIVAEVGRRTMAVLTVKDALVAPAGTVTLEGTLAAPLLLESVTIAPPGGAGPVSVTVPVEGVPPMTLAGFSVSDERVGGGGGAGVTVSEADLVAPL